MIIAVESASTDLSLALAEADGSLIALDGWTAGRRQGSELLPRLLALLEAHNRRLDATTAIAVGIGPGSFTGLRVGMSVAKGIAFGLQRPIVGIGSLDAWLAAESGAAGALARAGAREAYLLERGSVAPLVVDREAIGERPIGLVAPTELAEAFGLPRAVAPHRAAAALATLAVHRLAAEPAGDDLRRLEPAYLRAPRGIGP
ncbi:MAG TPA: tRNA (adenosine(37)-N6)-threonylcarbamoyltransferase complex dimerization subunit type 1 TsaB [Candidatus Limnocylindria bacterium]|nr:tRNA (adenosine(37)-N6)-threonylcarbamoyltransferase complex dimerization subunit type 1 TsaB [Candidatus Limnocylindria bacterium]